jgi:chromosome segregation ATPase
MSGINIFNNMIRIKEIETELAEKSKHIKELQIEIGEIKSSIKNLEKEKERLQWEIDIVRGKIKL